jgi:hypothetical protein
MEVFSSTDLKCWWNTTKKNVLKRYTPVPIRQWNCVKRNIIVKRKCLSDDEASGVIAELTQVQPNSAISKHM